MPGDDWITIEDTGGARQYIINQDKWAPMKIWGAVFAAAAVSALVTVASYNAPPAWVVITIFSGMATFVFGLGAILSIFFLMPLSMVRKAQVGFVIDKSGISFKEKVSSKSPDRVNIADISHIYYGSGGRSRVATQVTLHQTGTIAAAGADLGAGMAQALVQSSFGVWINARGQDIYLANSLTESKAQYLYTRVAANLELP